MRISASSFCTSKVTPALFERYPDAFAMAQADQKDVEEMIRSIGLYRNKAASVIAMSRQLVQDYDGVVPNDMDKLTPEQRTKNMRAVKNKDSEIELLLRRCLWEKGLRYRKNVKSVYGHPDIAFIGKKVAVFCDSEFWHGFDWENKQNEIKSRRDFWIPKIERNIQRDAEVNRKLKAEGWLVLRFCGKEIKTDVVSCADLVVKCLEER